MPNDTKIQVELIEETIKSFFADQITLSPEDKARLEQLTTSIVSEKVAALTSSDPDDVAEHTTNVHHLLATAQTMAARKYMDTFDAGLLAFQKVVAAAAKLLVKAIL
jgi:hypothetical protein